MTDLKRVLQQLNEDLNVLKEREAKQGSNVDLHLLHQIKDHQEAIALVEQASAGEITHAELEVASQPLEIDHSLLKSESPEQQRARQNRQAILNRVREYWVKGVLDQSLHNEVLIELGMEERREAVEQPWEMVVQTPDKPDRILAPDTRIVDVYEEMNRNLLILGEPGSGKTTMLLQLAKETIPLAEKDILQPIPVVFNLSTRAEKQLPLAEWLLVEFRTKYSIPEKIAQSWLEDNQLLLLLDGLDEVVRDQREGCVDAINIFHEEHLVPLVVCSRIADYETLTNRLNLDGAVLLQPLTPEQITVYFGEIGDDFVAAREFVQRDPTFQELVQSPLMLSMATLAYQGMSGTALHTVETVEAQRKHLFDTYIKSMFERRGTNQPYSSEQTVKWLGWLAGQMKQHDQSVFLIEFLQISWLPTKRQRLLCRGVAGLIAGLIFGLIVGLIGGSIFGLIVGLIGGLSIGLSMGLMGVPWFGLIGGLSIGLISGLGDIEPVETLSWSWKRAWEGLFNGLYTGLIVGLVGGLLGGLSIGLSIGLISGLGLGLMFGLWSGLVKPDVVDLEMRTSPNQGIRQSIRNTVIVGLIGGVFGVLSSGLSVGLGVGLLFGGLMAELLGELEPIGELMAELGVVGLISGPMAGLIYGLAVGLMAGLMFGLIFGLIAGGGGAVVKHYVLRLILYCNGYLLFNLVPFLDYCVDRIFLRRVGGGYIFIHRLLLEHFASLELEQ